MEFSALFKLPYFSESMMNSWIDNYSQLLSNPHRSMIANLSDFSNVEFISNSVVLDLPLLNEITDSLLCPTIGYSGKKIYLSYKTTFKIVEGNKEIYSKSIFLDDEQFNKDNWTTFLSESEAQYLILSSEKTSSFMVCDFSFLKESVLTKIKEIKEILEKKLPEDSQGNLMGLNKQYCPSPKDEELDEETKDKFNHHIQTYMITQKLDELVYALRVIHAV